MNVTPTMRNGIGIRTSDESVKQWATGRLAGERELDGPLGKVSMLAARSAVRPESRRPANLRQLDSILRPVHLTPGCRYSKS